MKRRCFEENASFHLNEPKFRSALHYFKFGLRPSCWPCFFTLVLGL